MNYILTDKYLTIEYLTFDYFKHHFFIKKYITYAMFNVSDKLLLKVGKLNMITDFRNIKMKYWICLLVSYRQ